MRFLFSILLAALVLAAAVPAQAQVVVPESEWGRLIGRRAIVIRKDGTDVHGKILEIDDRNVSIERGESILGVKRNWVQRILLPPGEPPLGPRPPLGNVKPATPPPVDEPAEPEPAPRRPPPPPPGPSELDPNAAWPGEKPRPVKEREREKPLPDGLTRKRRSDAPGYAPTEAELAGQARAPSPVAPIGVPGLYAGVVLRPERCVSNCLGTITTFGAELGYRYGAIALRFASYGGGFFVLPDLRGHLPLAVHRRVAIEPFFEVTPLLMKHDAGTFFQLVLRPGVRVVFRLASRVDAYIDPAALDIGVYSSGGALSSSAGVLRYVAGAGMRFLF